MEIAKTDIGQEFYDTQEDLSGQSSLLNSLITGKSGMVVVRAFPKEIQSKRNYLLMSDPATKFLSIYCDGSQGKRLMFEWFPNGEASEKDSGIECPENGKLKENNNNFRVVYCGSGY